MLQPSNYLKLAFQ